MQRDTQKIYGYLKKHWFTIGMAAIFIVAIFKKDFSFRINLHNPSEEMVPAQEPPTTPAATAKPNKEVFTENQSGNKASLLDKFDFSALKPDRTPALKEAKAIQQLDDELKNAFIKRFAHVAITEREKYGIPAAIIIANALLHSQAGISRLSATANNYFQLPCTTDWQGPTTTIDNQCYRDYENAWTSFRDHSLYITTGKYSPLRALHSSDHKGWAEALEKQRFSNLPNLAKQLMHLIEEYSLKELDNV
jgi:flagellum-specific peptidoglycan hydrolase FlgJ